MGFLEDMFDPDFMFDSEYKQRRDIQQLRTELASRAETLAPRIHALETRVDQLQLLCNALVSVIETKKLATREELEVLVQQIDLLDGVEDGKIGSEWRDAPRCAHCNRYVNPSREACLYCGRSLALQGAMVGGPYRGGAPGEVQAAPPRTATCAKCRAVVAQSQTYFTEQGQLVCSDCYQG